MLNRGQELLNKHQQENKLFVLAEKERIEKDIIDFDKLTKMLGYDCALNMVKESNTNATANTSKLEEQILAQTQRIEELVADNKKANISIADLEKELKEVKKQKSASDSKIKKLENKIEVLKTKVAGRGQTVISNKELKKLQSDKEKFEKQSNDWKNKYEQAMENDKTNSVADSVSELQTKLDEAYANNKQLLIDLTAAEQSRDNFKQIAEDMSKKNRELRQENNDLKAQSTSNNSQNADVEALKEEIERLQAEVEKYKRSSATWQRKHDVLENNIKASQEKKDDKGAKNNTTKEETKVEDRKPVADNSNKNKNNNKPSNNGSQNRVVGKVSNLVQCVNYKKTREDVTLYDGGDYYVMASTICQQITIIPRSAKFVVTPEVEKAYQDQLVKMGYPAQRTDVSPITVQSVLGETRFGYIARNEGKFGTTDFSDEDVFAGYVYANNTCYLYTWDRQEFANPVVYHLDAIVSGKVSFVHDHEKSLVSALVKTMYKQYKEDLAVFLKDRKAKELQDTLQSDEYNRQREKTDQMINSSIENAISSNNVIGDTTGIDDKPSGGRRKKNKNSAPNNEKGGSERKISNTLEKAADEF